MPFKRHPSGLQRTIILRSLEMHILDLDRQLNEMITNGHSVEAFDRFYAEGVVAQENDEPERVGREPWKQARLAMEANIRKFQAKVLANAAEGNISFSEWAIDAEIEGMGPMKIVQVAVRRWENGKVVHEHFYHK
jgi:SnoaL-like domain